MQLAVFSRMQVVRGTCPSQDLGMAFATIIKDTEEKGKTSMQLTRKESDLRSWKRIMCRIAMTQRNIVPKKTLLESM